MKSAQIIEKFINFFSKKHFVLNPASKCFIPADKSLMFVNAGMNQFKNVFLDLKNHDVPKVHTVQKCIRAGGKHNDLENVGHTSRHLTYFEMVGTFIFKGEDVLRDGITTIWHFITKELNFSKSKLWVTIYEGDEVARKIWETLIDSKRIIEMEKQDNYWQMGAVGPCGPCTEIMFDRGKKFGTAKSPADDFAGERFLELWNIVIMSEIKDERSVYPMPIKKIDTGAGLERLEMISEGCEDIFSTTRFLRIKKEFGRVVGVKENSENRSVFNIVSDHLSCAAISISDGAIPDSAGRGFIVRKILRRAFKYVCNLFTNDHAILFGIMDEVIDAINEAVPGRINIEDTAMIRRMIKEEEEGYYKNLRRNKRIFEEIVAGISNNVIDARSAFNMKDRHGLDIDDIYMMAEENGMSVDIQGLNEMIQESRERSRSQIVDDVYVEIMGNTETIFTGYDNSNEASEIQAIYKDGQSLEEGRGELYLSMTKTPFYAEKGGQISDIGIIKISDNVLEVVGLVSKGKEILHKIKSDFTIRKGEKCIAIVDAEARSAVCRAHSATHLLQKALQLVVSRDIVQAGSKVGADTVRFDFGFSRALSDIELEGVENIVYSYIISNIRVISSVQDLEVIKRREDVMCLFDDKYTDKVRVVEIGESKELCGGTHCKQTGEIGVFKIVSEKSSSSGVRRIEAVVGKKAFNLFREDEIHIKNIVEASKVTKKEDVIMKINTSLAKMKILDGDVKLFMTQNAGFKAREILENIRSRDDVIFIEKVPNMHIAKHLVSIIKKDIDKLQKNCIFIAVIEDGDVVNVNMINNGIQTNIREAIDQKLNIRSRDNKGVISFVAKINLKKFIEIIKNLVHN